MSIKKPIAKPLDVDTLVREVLETRKLTAGEIATFKGFPRRLGHFAIN
jgi:hypothetical protein